MKLRGINLLLCALIAFVCAGLAVGQTTTAKDQLQIKLTRLVREVKAAQNKQEKQNAFDWGANIQTFALALALRKSPQVFVVQAEEARVDKQVGGSDQNAGSTSLTSKGSIPAILGFAVENGALTRTTSGTTITFRGNPVGIIKVLGESGFVESYDEDDAATRFLRRFSFAFSFDTSRGVNESSTGSGTMMNVFTGDQQQLSSYSFRFDAFNRRDPRHKAYNKQWDTMIAGDAALMTTAIDRVAESLQELDGVALQNPDLKTWYDQAAEAVSVASDSEVEKVIEQEFDKLKNVRLSDELQRRVEAFIEKFNSFLQSHDKILEAVAKGGIVTFEYTNRREINLPSLSNFNLIAETGLFRGKADLTGNLSFTIFNEKPKSTDPTKPIGRLRDFQLSGQLDVPLSNPLKTGNFVLTFSGKFQKIMEDTMMMNSAMTGMTGQTGMMMETKGNIGIGQIKLTIPVKGSGVKIPISFTYANRSELIKEKVVRGNIGITFDLDVLLSKKNP